LLATEVYTAAAPEARRRLHERLAESVDEPEQQAYHLARSISDPDERIAARIAAAARTTALRGAQEAAAPLFAAPPRRPPPDRLEELAQRLLDEASARFHAGDVQAARRLAERALATSSEGPRRANGLLLLANVAWVDHTSDAATGYLERALGEPDLEQALRARIHATLAFYNTPRPQVAVRHADAALELIDEQEQPALLADVLIHKFFAEVCLDSAPRLDVLERGLALEATTASPRRSVLPLVWFRFVDDFEAARARFQLEEQWHREHGEEGLRANRLSHIAETELRAGNWELAESYAEEAASLVEQVAASGPWSVPLRTRAAIDAHRGRLGRARETLIPFIEDAEGRGLLWWAGTWLAVLGFVELTAGDDRAADRALVRKDEHFDVLGVRDLGSDRSEPDHVEALTGLGELDRAGAVLERLAWRGRRLPRAWIDATLPRASALLLAAQGDTEAALRALAGAQDVPRLPFELARNLLVQGVLERRLKRKRAAADTLNRSLELFDRLGSPPWSERARGELARVGLRQADRFELTESERRIAELAASGLTNREVAQAAFVSPKTVEANLARVYRKLGISSRAELGARMGSGPEQT
jgi:DNA-binding CsgD family transcriptional regulator